MFEDVPGRLLSGALWGLGAGLALNLLRGQKQDRAGRATGPNAVRPVAKSLMKAYVASADRVRSMTAEARESLGDMYAEVQAERRGGAAQSPAEEQGSAPEAANGAARRSRTRSAPAE